MISPPEPQHVAAHAYYLTCVMIFRGHVRQLGRQGNVWMLMTVVQMLLGNVDVLYPLAPISLETAHT